MKKLINNIVKFSLSLSLLAGLNACNNVAPNTIDLQYPTYASNIEQTMVGNENKEILVKFKKGLTKANINEFQAKYGLRTVKVLPASNIHVMKNEIGMKNEQILGYIQNDPMVLYAEINREISFGPDYNIVPVFNILSNYQNMIGKTISVKGIYFSSRSGAIIETSNGKLSIVDLDSSVLPRITNLKDGSKISITGVVKEVKGFNLTNNIGILPVSIKVSKQ
ncbi:MAG: hypothetical protein KatS3mg068_0319 [Candidatus Sericytochromatia bacterium]|nr:MAG: hypothetical protein KatS3mg068_0319 [Candidatus Sericytochromatia bacterium]